MSDYAINMILLYGVFIFGFIFGALIFVLINLYSCWRDKFCQYDLPTVKISWNSKGVKKFRG